MKPTRNRYYCLAAERRKMLFESENQANNFIKFDAAEMEELGGKVPVRSYYCPICIGWHVTSNPDAEYFETHPSNAELAINVMQERKKKKKNEKKDRFSKVFENTAILVEQNCLPKAIQLYVERYHSIKSDASQRETAKLFLQKAFEIESKFVNQIIESGQQNDPAVCKPARNGLRALKKAAKGWDEVFSDYLESLSGVVETFPKPSQKTISELTAEELEKLELLKKEKEEKNLNKSFRKFKQKVRTIYACMLIGQRSECQHRFSACTKEAGRFADYPQFREQLIECIDTLMKYPKMFTEFFPGDSILSSDKEK